ncbi:hypothetical protein [Desulfosporosinus sp. FKB]|uniref:hypothetical protein n=1 Tax=Desulfosporosinus sp. FKB TaxID=1969835 RepID=UPI000B4A1236|nr:hypothetical protein [Desulfosporosinus sp. FKB]
MPNLDTLTYDNLFAGNIDVVTEEITIGENQTILRGDLLEKKVTETIAVEGAVGTTNRTVATNFVRPSGAADENSFYAVASEDITTGAGVTAKTIGYRAGVFNENSMRFGGASTADDNRDILAAQNIYLRQAVKQ